MLGHRVNLRKLATPKGTYKWLASYREGDQLRRKYFKTKREGEQWAAGREEDALEHGQQSLTSAERSAVLDHRDKLADLGLDLRTILEAAVAAAEDEQSNKPTVDEIIPEFFVAKEREGLRHRSMTDIKSRVTRFGETFKGRTLASLEANELESWLHSLKQGPQSLVNWRRVIGGFLNWCVRRDIIAANPMQRVAAPKVRQTDPSILTPDQMARLMDCTDNALIPYMALAGFAGLRPESELQRLDWADVDLERASVAVPKEGKTGKRHVDLSDNLVEWLRPHQRLSGPVSPPCRRDLFDDARKRAGLFESWAPDILRHSFASHWLPVHKDLHGLSLQMGNSSAIVKRHYHNAIPTEQGERWWSIYPSALEDKVINL